MANRYRKMCLPSVTIKEIQIKSTIRYHFTPVRMTTIQETRDKCWLGYRGQRILTALDGVAQSTERQPANQRVLVGFPVRAHAWVVGQVPRRGMQEATTH